MSGAQTQTQQQSPGALPQGNGAVATAERPRPAHHVPLQQLNLGQMLSDPRVKKMMADTATKHLTPDRMLRVVANAVRKVPKLAMVNPMSLLGAMITCQTLGLEPNTPLGHAYLIPFEKRGKNPQSGRWETLGVDANLIVGYQGLIDLMRRSGSLVSIHADVVYDEDVFSFEYGSDMHLRHIPKGLRDNRRALFAYAHVKLTDGEAFEVLPYEEILRIRDNTEGYKAAMRAKAENYRNWDQTPWIKYEHEMACKTMVRRVAKWAPKSIEFANALAIDNAGDSASIDFSAIGNDPSLAGAPDLVTTYTEGEEEQEPAPPQQQQQQPQPQQAQSQQKEPEPAKSEPQPQPAQQQQSAGNADDITATTDKIIAQLAEMKSAQEIASFEEMIAQDLNALPLDERRRYATAKTERIAELKKKAPKG